MRFWGQQGSRRSHKGRAGGAPVSQRVKHSRASLSSSEQIPINVVFLPFSCKPALPSQHHSTACHPFFAFFSLFLMISPGNCRNALIWQDSGLFESSKIHSSGWAAILCFLPFWLPTSFYFFKSFLVFSEQAVLKYQPVLGWWTEQE